MRRRKTQIPAIAAAITTAAWLACGVAASGAPSTAGSTVAVTVASATNLDASACATGTANITDFGTVLPGTSNVTSSDCTLTWGSSNDTAMLRLYQADGEGQALNHIPDGPLDATFDGQAGMPTAFPGNGRVSTSFSAGSDAANGVTVQPDGKLIVVGSSNAAADWAIARYNADGSLDTAFSGDGMLTLAMGTGTEVARDVEVQPDGQIVVGGYAQDATTSQDVCLARLNPDGSLDAAFDGASGTGDGKFCDAFLGGPVSEYAMSLSLQPDGKIVVAGERNLDFLVARYTSTGIRDTTFSGDGYDVQATGERLYGLALQPDGKIVASGPTATNMAIVRYLTNGTLDTTFDGDSGIGNGLVVTDIAGGNDWGGGVALTSTRAVVSASSDVSGWHFGAVAYNLADGTLDTSFSTDGKVIDATAAAIGYGVLVETDGSVVVSGGGWVLRYAADGSPDTTLDGDGARLIGGTTYSGLVRDLSGRYVAVGNEIVTSNFGLDRLQVLPVSDYASGTSDWTVGSNMFGACLRAVSGAGVAATWTINGGNTCPASDGAWWKPLAQTAGGAGSKVAASTTPGTTGATSSLRFGFRAGSSQLAGLYNAQVTFAVVAPNV